MDYCFLYPGQGAQYPGMGKDLWEASSRVKALFELASDVMGRDMKALVFDAPEEDLKRTDNTQPAITLVNTAVKEYLAEQGIVSRGCAGFSLGEYSALEDAGVITLEEMFRLIKVRGEFMQAAGEKYGTGEDAPGMAAVIGLTAEKIEELFGGGSLEVYPANYNAPTQIVLAGTAQGLAQAEEICKAQGARRFMPLKVSAPFHSPFMAEAGRAFGEILKSYTFRDPVKTIYSNVSGGTIQSGEEAKRLAEAQITSPVRWVKEEEAIIAHSADPAGGPVTLLECGPGKVLCGLWKSMESPLACLPCGTLDQIRAILEKNSDN